LKGLAETQPFGNPHTGPNGEPNQVLLATQASLKLVRLRLGSGVLTYSSG